MRILAVIGALAIIVGIGAADILFRRLLQCRGDRRRPGHCHLGTDPGAHGVDQSPCGRPAAGLHQHDPASVQAGAKAFAAHGCTNCHGGPGVNWAKFSEGLHPDPPDLKEVVDQLSPAQLFWVVKNGINMTGMPSFAQAGAKDDEIWSIVAFLKKLPSVSEADYKAWTAPSSRPLPPAAK